MLQDSFKRIAPAGRQSRGPLRARHAPMAALAVGVLVALVALALPGAALAGPAQEEYVLDIPEPREGKKSVKPEEPSAQPGSLPPGVSSELGEGGVDEFLARSATSRDLGAPRSKAKSKGKGGKRKGRKGSGSEAGGGASVTDSDAAAGSILGVAGSALGGSLLFGGLLAATAGLSLWSFMRRRRADD